MIDFNTIRASQLDAFAPYHAGDPFASLIAIKGRPGASEARGDAPFSGADGLALDKAFGALGWGFGSLDTRVWFGVLLAPHSKAVLSSEDLRLICEIVDPLVIVVLDEDARAALIEAFTSTEEGFPADFTSNSPCVLLGRRFVSVADFEGSLANEEAKQQAWAQLKRCVFDFVR